MGNFIMIYTKNKNGDCLAYRSKHELIDCLRNGRDSSGMGYRPKSADTIAEILHRIGSTRLTAAAARASDCTFATNGLATFIVEDA